MDIHLYCWLQHLKHLTNIFTGIIHVNRNDYPLGSSSAPSDFTVWLYSETLKYVCVFVFVLVAPVCSSQHRCVTCWRGSSWCCVTSWWATWITPWCTTWSGDSLSSNCTSYTTCWRYTQTISASTVQVVTSSLTVLSPLVSLPLLCCQVADRLFSSFGQDILDALYWTATEPKEKKRAHIGVIPHFLMAVLYVCILTD